MSKYFNYGICRVHFADDGDGGGGGEPQSPVNSDGTFVENWADKYPEHKATLSRFKKFDDLVTSHMSQRKKFGHDPDTMIQIPKDDSPDDVKAAFHKARGKPDTADEYEYKLSEELGKKVTVDEEKLTAFKKFAHEKLHLNQGEFAEALNFYYTGIANDIDNYDMIFTEQQKEEMEKGQAELKKKWGNGYDERVLRSNAVLRKFGGEEAVASYNAQNSPLMAVFLNNIAEAMSEDTLKGIVTTTAPSTAQISSKITEVRTEMSKIQKENPATFKNDPRYKELLERKHNLYKSKST